MMHMNRFGVFFLGLGLLCLSTMAIAETAAPVYRGEPSALFMREWLVLGPISLERSAADAPEVSHMPGFARDYLGGEKTVAPKVGDEVALEGETLRWKRYESDNDLVYLDDALGTQWPVIGYAYAEIEAMQEHLCLLSLGSNDGCRVWLNGERICDRGEARGMSADDDFVAVLLQKGINRLLIKVEERGNIWGFCARILPFDADTLNQKSPLFRVTVDAQGQAALEFSPPRSVAGKLVEKAALSVACAESQSLIWEGPWNGKKNLTLPIPDDAYRSYALSIDTVLQDGTPWRNSLNFQAGLREEFVLLAEGKSEYSIVVAKEASTSEQWAAKELQHWLKECTGLSLPVVGLEGLTGDKHIVLGYNQLSARLLKLPAPPEELDESFRYENVGASIVIYGGAMRGTMYGVMSFLEREFGLRWYTPTVTKAPQRSRFSFDRLFFTDAPGVRVRNDFYYEAFDPIWATRNKMNGRMSVGDPNLQPGGLESYWAVHTFYRFLPPSEFFADHPEYYSLIDGERKHDRTQLCLTNPDVLRITIERLRAVMRKEPNHLIYSVSQNDWRNPCQCAKCQAIAKQEGGEAGPLIWFVNQVADAVKEEFPDKFVGTLAYQYTRKPCKTLRPRENVVIRLCSIECCFAHDFESCPENASFIEDLKGWAAISPHLYIWDYVVNFSHYIQPYPNFNVLQPNIQTLAANKSIGIMEQAAYQSRGGEFAELRAYVIARLLWDPECHFNEALNDFMYGYYGRAGQYVRQYFDLLHDQVNENTHIHLGLSADDPIFSDEFITEAQKIFAKAEKVADSDAVRQRVEMAELPLMYLKCKRQPVQAKYEGVYDRFCAIVEREGITHYAERGAAHRKAFHDMMDAAQ